MRSLKQALVLLSLFLMLSPIAYADKNEEVALWAAQTLVKTFAISYTTKPSDFEEIKKNYSFNAWNAVVVFLGHKRAKIHSEQLTLHPILEGVPTIVKSGNHNGIHFWHITQNLIARELNVKIKFILVVVARAPASNYPYIIQSINMKLSRFAR